MDEREAVQKRTPPRKLELTQADLPFLAGKPQSFLGLRDVVLLVEVRLWHTLAQTLALP